MKTNFLLFICLLVSLTGLAQEVVVTGKVTDAETGEAMPFVSIHVKNTTIGTTTDFDGYYKLKLPKPEDSLTAAYIGYVSRTRPLGRQPNQVLNFQLSPSSISLTEVVIRPGENPAFRIMRQVVDHKDRNDKRRLTAYQYESYSKLELDIDNLSEKFRKKKMLRPVTSLLDSLQLLAGDDGKPILPVFISESLSDYYYLRNPQKVKEIIKATKVTGVGMEDGSTVSQLVGSSLQDYNFYQNWLTVVNKQFVSPIADGWKTHYDYELTDSLYIGSNWCYKIEVTPKRKQDLAFRGTIWIADTTFALKQIDVQVGQEANLNYIEKIKIQQELEPTTEGAWLPVKTRLLIDIAEINDNWAGLIAKLYFSAKNVVVNQPRPVHFFEDPIELQPVARQLNEDFWKQNRHDSLSSAEQQVFALIDSIREMPMVKTYVEIADILVNGYKRVGKFDIGPYAYTYAHNNLEGHRFRIGIRTNPVFSRKIQYQGYLAYGTRDGNFKYGSAAKYIFSRRRWSEAGIGYKKDVEQVGLTAERLAQNALFAASSRFGTLSRPFLEEETRVWAEREVLKNVSQRLSFRHRTFDPYFDFAFMKEQGNERTLQQRFRTSEVVFETRFASHETFVQGENDRISLGNGFWPVLTMRYTLGLKDVFHSDFGYHRFDAGLSQKLNTGTLGYGFYSLQGGHILSELPYPLLEVHLGNETPFYNRLAYSLMNSFEFVSDSYVSFGYEHHFEGFLLNRVPLVRRLKWRLVANGDLLYGHLSDGNRRINLAGEGNDFRTFTRTPYAEVGYGIENILKFIRVSAFHRLTYLDHPDVRKFGVKVSAQFSL